MHGYQKIEYVAATYDENGNYSGLVSLSPPVFAWMKVETVDGEEGIVTGFFDDAGAPIANPPSSGYRLTNGGIFETPPFEES